MDGSQNLSIITLKLIKNKEKGGDMLQMEFGQILNKFTNNYWIIISAVILFFWLKP
jgi:hypothetical protein